MDLQQREAYSEYGQRTYNAPFHKLMRMFTLSILISFIGTLVGTQVPPAMFMPITIIEFIMLIAAFFIRRQRKSVGYAFVFTFTFLSGVTLYPAIYYYMSTSGAAVVNEAFLLTTLIFAGLSAYAYYSKRDFSFLGGFLTVALLTLVGFSIIGMFFGGFGTTASAVFGFLGVLIFSGFILFDISRYKHGVPEEVMPLAVLNLYLNFINLFLSLLRILGISRD